MELHFSFGIIYILSFIGSHPNHDHDPAWKQKRRASVEVKEGILSTTKETASQIEHPEDTMEYTNCNLCSANDAQHLYEIDGFNLVRCQRCGLIYVNPRLMSKEIEKIYAEPEYFHNPKFYDFDGFLYGYAEYVSEREEIEKSFEKTVKRLETFKPSGRLFEVGCGLGYFLDVAHQRGWEVTGIEISKSAARYAHLLGLNVLCGSFEDQMLPPLSFDAGVLLDVIEHLHDPTSVLRTAHRLLKPGAVLVIGTPNAGSLISRILGSRWEDMRRVREHLYLFSRQTLTQMLAKAGFQVVEVTQYGRYFKVGQILKRWELYHRGLARSLAQLSRVIGLHDKIFYIVPYTKMIVFAKKI